MMIKTLFLALGLTILSVLAAPTNNDPKGIFKRDCLSTCNGYQDQCMRDFPERGCAFCGDYVCTFHADECLYGCDPDYTCCGVWKRDAGHNATIAEDIDVKREVNTAPEHANINLLQRDPGVILNTTFCSQADFKGYCQTLHVLDAECSRVPRFTVSVGLGITNTSCTIFEDENCEIDGIKHFIRANDNITDLAFSPMTDRNDQPILVDFSGKANSYYCNYFNKFGPGKKI
ncbi:hypothetical protein EJ08DRAFT_706176 [Tothia fuscella]|uniref:Uncharacterized protein n=1 Tax=Tothia fuscella TaxID=1048955 RepID=A0A9P4U1E5_9PEZI|nr:hypothetical protein EJ08DRAFT_706176 [Tothia fuscella]